MTKIEQKPHPGGSSNMSLQTAGVDVTFPRESTIALEPVPPLVSILTEKQNQPAALYGNVQASQ